VTAFETVHFHLVLPCQSTECPKRPKQCGAATTLSDVVALLLSTDLVRAALWASDSLVVHYGHPFLCELSSHVAKHSRSTSS
jgi:hypothetical protein